MVYAVKANSAKKTVTYIGSFETNADKNATPEITRVVTPAAQPTASARGNFPLQCGGVGF